MKHSALFVYIFFFFCYYTYSQVSEEDTIVLKNYIYYLCHDSLEGRAGGSEGERMAGEFVEKIFYEHKLDYFFGDSFIELFTYIDASEKAKESRNISGYINNNADSSILIMAHIDHLGYGGAKSRSFTTNKIHYGADDNASGVAVLLLLTQYLQNMEFKRYNYIFLATGAHEEGYFGASFFVLKHNEIISNLKLIINLDMVGRLSKTDDIFFVFADDKAQILLETLTKETENMYNYKFVERKEGDHTPFLNKGYSVMHLTTGLHNDYHKISDTPDKINYKGMLRVLSFLLDFLASNG